MGTGGEKREPCPADFQTCRGELSSSNVTSSVSEVRCSSLLLSFLSRALDGP